MSYIVFDLEFNQGFLSQDINGVAAPLTKNLYEIVQIGAVKLDSDFQPVTAFNHYVKPTFISKMNPFVTELTGITAERLSNEAAFPDVYSAFVRFVQDDAPIFCVWGMSDMKALFGNAGYHNLDITLLPKSYINVQPYVSKHLRLSSKKQLSLETAVESLGVVKTLPFHNAYHDAYYTAEVFKRIRNQSIVPSVYDPSRISRRNAQRKAKSEIDYDALLKQFEKMYTRELSEEERGMVKLAYMMGRTRQFVKEADHAAT